MFKIINISYPNWTWWGAVVVPFGNREAVTSSPSTSQSEFVEFSTSWPQLDWVCVFCDCALGTSCEFAELLDTCGGIVTIRRTDNVVLMEPTTKNGSMNPPASYSHAPTAGPVIQAEPIKNTASKIPIYGKKNLT